MQEEIEVNKPSDSSIPYADRFSKGDVLFVLPRGVDGTASRYRFAPGEGVFTGPAAAVSDYVKGFASLENAFSLALGTTIATAATKFACDIGKTIAGARGANPQVGCAIGTTVVSSLAMIPPAVKALNSVYHAGDELSTFIATGDPSAGYNATTEALNVATAYGLYRWRPGITVNAVVSNSAIATSLKLSWVSKRTPAASIPSNTDIKITFSAPGGNTLTLAGQRIGTTDDGRTVVQIASGFKKITAHGVNGELPLLAPPTNLKLFGLTLPPTSVPTYLSLSSQSSKSGSSGDSGGMGGAAGGGNGGERKPPSTILAQEDLVTINVRDLMRSHDVESWAIIRSSLLSLMELGQIKRVELPTEMPRTIELTSVDYDKLGAYLADPSDLKSVSRPSDFQQPSIQSETTPKSLARKYWVPQNHLLTQLRNYIDANGGDGIREDSQPNNRLGESKYNLSEETAGKFIAYLTENRTLYPRSSYSRIELYTGIASSSRFSGLGHTENAQQTITTERMMVVANAIRDRDIPSELLADELVRRALDYLLKGENSATAVIKVLPQGQTEPQFFIDTRVRLLASKIFNSLYPPEKRRASK